MKSRPRWYRIAAATVTFGLVVGLAACTSSKAAQNDNPNNSSAVAAGKPQSGGSITVLTNNFSTGWVSSKSSTNIYEAQVWGQITDKLLYVDNSGKIFPWLATSWDVGDGGKQYTLHLRSGVTFSDGTAFNAAAAVENINLWAKGDSSRGITRIGLFPKTFVSAQVVDDSTVRVTLSRPDVSFLPTLGYHGSIILSPKALALSVQDQSDLSNEIGTGPFTVKSWKSNQQVVLVKRADYNWAPGNAQHTGAAYLDQITFRVVPDDLQRGTSVESGQADIAQNVPPEELDAAKKQGYTVQTPRFFGAVHGIQIRVSNSVVSDVKVRQAIQHAIDRDQILKTVYTSDWLPATGIFNSNVPESSDATASLFNYDPDESKKLLDEAGWTVGSDGIRTKNGEQLSFTVYPSPFVSEAKLEWQVLAQQLKAIGVGITIKNTDVTSYAKWATDSSLPLYELNSSFTDIGNGAALFWGSKGQNQFDTTDPKLNQLITQLQLSTDEGTRKQLASQLQDYILSQAYFIPLEQISQGTYLLSPKVHGAVYNIVARPWYYDTWLSK